MINKKINIQEKYYFLFYVLFIVIIAFSLLAVFRNLPENNFLGAGLISLLNQQEEQKIEETEEEETQEQVKVFQMITQSGEGLTHLARRALKEYLQEKDIEITTEHKIYVEDFVQKRLDQVGLHPGDQVSISSDLIEQGISQALQLQESELENLKQFSVLVF